MASWNIPALINKISEDVPALKSLLTALFKWTDADTTDVPVGAKRLEAVTGGRQIQEKTASGWASVGKLMHDADTLDGWHAAQSALANHVVVRDSNGKIAGDVLGNANTATTASGLAQNYVTPIANGGTGATSAVNARANLGANNGSNINTGVVGTAYGGTGRTDGKVTDVHLTDYNTGAVGVGQLGHAATKNGVSADSLIVPGAYYCTGCTVALHYPSTADCFIRVEGSGEVSSDVFLVQKLTEMTTSIEYRRLSYDGGASWDAWVPFDTAVMQKLFGNNGYGSEIKDERLSAEITVKDWDASHDYSANILVKAGGEIYRSVAASGPGTSAGAVNPTQDANAVYWEVFGKGGSVPVGTVIWLSTSTVPVGFLLCNGQAVGRTTYPDLFGAIGTTYGAGDGSTTFNLPNLIDKFIEGADSNIGDSVAAGLPNITGSVGWKSDSIFTYVSGAFTGVAASGTKVVSSSTSSSLNYSRGSFSASNSNSIYGNSNTVQPPAVKLLPCIKAYSDVDNLGSLDVAQLENYVQNNFVHLTGNESISGEKSFAQPLLIRNDEYDFSTTPSSNVGSLLSFRDKNNVQLGYVRSEVDTSKMSSMSLFTLNPDSTTNTYTSLWTHLTTGGTRRVGCTADMLRPTGGIFPTLGQAGNYRWGQIYSTSSSISTSDERQKQDISGIPDAVLDAWGKIGFLQYRMRDAAAKKGIEARLHTGLVAQRIKSVFDSAGLSASNYGFFCHDEWDASPAEGEDPAVEAGDEFSLRYEEALCMEAAYQRRRADRAEARLASLETRLAVLETRFDNLN